MATVVQCIIVVLRFPVAPRGRREPTGGTKNLGLTPDRSRIRNPVGFCLIRNPVIIQNHGSSRSRKSTIHIWVWPDQNPACKTLVEDSSSCINKKCMQSMALVNMYCTNTHTHTHNNVADAIITLLICFFQIMWYHAGDIVQHPGVFHCDNIR